MGHRANCVILATAEAFFLECLNASRLAAPMLHRCELDKTSVSGSASQRTQGKRPMIKIISRAAFCLLFFGAPAQSSTSNPPTGPEVPGPSQALFNQPFYTCLRNFYVATT